MKTIDDFNFKDKKVLIRVDFNVPLENGKVIDSTRDNLPYNKNQYPGFDAHGQQIGEYTELDVLHDSTSSRKISDNPMDENWAGATYTKQMVDSGKYEGNQIRKPVLFNPKTEFNPSAPSLYPPPKDIL